MATQTDRFFGNGNLIGVYGGFGNNPCFIIYKARRYKCKYCNSLFFEQNPFNLKNDSISLYTTYAVLRDLLRHTNTFSDVAHNYNLSVHKVIKIFDEHVEYRRSTLPTVICFDEFYRSRKSKEKYAFVNSSSSNGSNVPSKSNKIALIIISPNR